MSHKARCPSDAGPFSLAYCRSKRPTRSKNLGSQPRRQVDSKWMTALSVTYCIVDAKQAVTVSDGATQSLYRETQLALRAVVGTRDLDTFLTEKDAVTNAFEEAVRRRAGELGLEIISVGIRDVILPGEMKDLMNKVTEAKKAAEANLIVRREETAAMRSQANTAKLLADNPTLMRLRELEVLEKVATSGKLNVVLGEKGLADRVVNLL